jgi:hypothetical protein
MNESIADESPAPPRRSIRAVVALALIGALAAILFALAHDAILDPIIDVGRDMYVAARITTGQHLYRDLRYNYPPLPPYLLSIVMRLLGATLGTVQLFNLVVAAITAAALYRTTLLLWCRRSAIAALFLFVSLSFAGATTWNASFLMPYAIATTVGMMFVLLFASAALTQLKAPSKLAMFATALFGTLACWSKHEQALAVAGTFTVAALLYRALRPSFALFAAINLAGVAFASFFFSSERAGRHWIRNNILDASLTASEASHRFNELVRGAGENLPRNVSLLVASAGLTLLLLWIIRRFESTTTAWQKILLLFVMAVVELLIAPMFFRGAPLLLLAIIVFTWRRERESPLLLMAILALLSLVRIPLDASAGWYGFALIVPTYVVAAGLLSGDRRWTTPRTALLVTPLFLFVAGIALLQQFFVYSNATNVVTTPRGSFYDPLPDRALVLNDAVEWCSRSGARTLVVFPEGISLNFFTGQRNPLSYYLFTPVETADPAIEQRILAEMQSERPELVALVSRDVSEYGSQGFGIDYDQQLMRYVREHYVVAHHIERPSFGAVVMRRSDLPPTR